MLMEVNVKSPQASQSDEDFSFQCDTIVRNEHAWSLCTKLSYTSLDYVGGQAQQSRGIDRRAERGRRTVLVWILVQN